RRRGGDAALHYHGARALVRAAHSEDDPSMAKSRPVAAPETPPRSRRGSNVVAVLVLLFVAVFSAFGALKYRYYLYNDFDFGIFAQAMEQLLRGSLYNSIRGTIWLGDHSSLVLFALAPIYAVFRHPVTLLVIQ